jgi:hypothetical protein
MTAWIDIQQQISGAFVDEDDFNELVTNDMNIAERVAAQETLYSLSAVPKGTICLWYGTEAAAAALDGGWQVCDGTNGLPDLRGAFVMGAKEDADIGETGGQSSHYHANGTGVTGAAGGHSHTGGTVATSYGSTSFNAGGSILNWSNPTHSHWITSPSFNSVADHTHALYGTGSTAALPPYRKLYWIGKL